VKAIILAAGIGSRVRPLTDNTPKSLLKIGEKTILEQMLTNIRAVGITEVAIITGYLEEKIKSFIAVHFGDLSVTFIKNEQYMDTNTGYSLLLAKDFIGSDDFVKFDADVVFEQAVLEKLLKETIPNALCIDTNIHLEKEEVKVILGEGNKVLEVGKKLDPHKAHGESIGIEKIGGEAVHMLFSELERLMQDPANYKEYYDDSYTTLVANGSPFAAVDITGLKWVEIDTHEDYDRAQQLFS
jgi:choline kinase